MDGICIWSYLWILWYHQSVYGLKMCINHGEFTLNPHFGGSIAGYQAAWSWWWNGSRRPTWRQRKMASMVWRIKSGGFPSFFQLILVSKPPNVANFGLKSLLGKQVFQMMHQQSRLRGIFHFHFLWCVRCVWALASWTNFVLSVLPDEIPEEPHLVWNLVCILGCWVFHRIQLAHRHGQSMTGF